MVVAIVFADNVTDLQGTITARGGVEAGNGGFIETSGKRLIIILQLFDASARAEGFSGGEWLIDPDDITITATTTSGIGGDPNWVSLQHHLN